FAGKRGTTSVAQASSTMARAWRSTILPVSWLWTSMVFSSRWWGWFHNTILEEDHVGLSCYGSYAYVRAYGIFPLLQPGLQRASLQDDRRGQLLEALCAANLKRVCGALALNALEV